MFTFLVLLLASTASFAANTEIEFQHILACQVSDAKSPAYGAINDVWGAPTWVVPGEMAVAAFVLSKGQYADEARAACDYLVRVQDPDGSWCNQYSTTWSVDSAKHARQTAQVMILLGEVGGYPTAMSKARTWLASLQDGPVKTGNDDGLICGGYDSGGGVIQDRWTSDNAWAVLAFDHAGDTIRRDRIVNAINSLLVSSDHWVQKINGAGTTTDGTFGWINFAPAFTSLAKFGVTYPAGLADGIRTRLQVASGADAGAVYENQASPKYMPGIGFQATIAWHELGVSGQDHACWAELRSGLWTTTPDGNGDAGGWVDWRVPSPPGQANWWERFIDTSAYYIMSVNGWEFAHDPPVLEGLVAASPPALRAPGTTAVTLTITNAGGAATPVAATLRITGGEDLVTPVWCNWSLGPPPPCGGAVAVAPPNCAPLPYVSSLGPGESVTFSWTITALRAGRVSFVASAYALDNAVNLVARDYPGAVPLLGLSAGVEGLSEIAVYPNPVAGDEATVALELEGSARRIEVALYNTSLDRALVARFSDVTPADGGVTVPRILGLAPGLYLVRVKVEYVSGERRTFPLRKLVIRR